MIYIWLYGLLMYYSAFILWFDHFLDSGQKFVKFFVGFLENLKKSKRHPEINWPLKDAETLLSTAIYQANQKLDSIKKAKENPVSSEELIKYAHRISASNAVSAPLNWQQG